MSQDNKKLIFQIEGLYNKFLSELAELEKRRQEILDMQKNKLAVQSETNYGGDAGKIK